MWVGELANKAVVQLRPFARAGACGDLRAAVVSVVTARAAKLARLTTHTQTAAVPTLTIAARLYNDAERADEITTRNRIVHPLFARGDLRVLSS